MNKIIIFIGLMFSMLSTAFASSMSALNNKKKSEDVTQVSSYEATVTLTTTGKRRDSEKVFTIWRQLQPDRIHYKMLTRFHKPPTIKNEGILFLEAANDKSDVLLYLPSFKKIRRIENNNQSGSFMGSVFSYADISPSHYTDLNAERLKDEKCPGTKIECYVIKSEGKTAKVKHRSGYKYSKSWVRKDNLVPVQVEGYDKKNKLVKTIKMQDYEQVGAKNKKFLAKLVTGIRASDGATTVFKITDLNTSKSISNDIFTRENLENP